MKKLTTIAALFLFTLGLSSICFAETVRLSYSNFFPPTHIQSQLAKQWCEEVEKRTGGKVVVDYYPGSTLTRAKNNYDGVVDGISDIGMSCFAYTRGRFPVMAALDLPLGYTSGVQATNAANAVVEKFQPRELRDVEVMYVHAHGPGLLFTTEKPVDSRAALEGVKIRSTGNSAKLIKALGGTPVGKPMPESYQSLQKGVVDGSIHPIESNKGWKLAEVCKFGTKSYRVAYTTTFFVVMNKDKWAEIDPASRKAIAELNAEWADKHGAAWDESDKEGMEFFLSKGGTMVDLSDSAAWVEAAKPVIAGYHDSVKGKRFDSREVVGFIQETMKQ